jgi:excisionase family DNA binding protein
MPFDREPHAWRPCAARRAGTTIGQYADAAKQVNLPALLTCDEVAQLLRTSKKAIWAMSERKQLPGIVRIGRRLLFRQDALLDWLRQKSTPSLER